MADEFEEELKRLHRQSSFEDEVRAAHQRDVGPSHGFTAGLLHKAGEGATFRASKLVSSPETLAKTRRFETEHPIAAFGAEGVGMVAPFFTPLGWLRTLGLGGRAVAGAAERLGQVATSKPLSYVLPYRNFLDATARGARARTVLHESGKGALKTGALMRGFDELEDPSRTGDPVTDLPRNATKRLERAFDLPRMAIDYGVGAPAGWVGGKVGERVGGTASKAAAGYGAEPSAARAIAVDIANDAPPGQGVQETIRQIRNMMYGEDRTLARKAPGSGVPQEAERRLASLYVNLTERGLSDAQAEQTMGRLLFARARRAVGNPAHADAWMINPRTGTPYVESTMGSWARAAGNAYRDRNRIASNVPELVALASGGEAPALGTTLTKLLNLKSEGKHRSIFLRNMRERQGQIGPQTEAILQRYSGPNIQQTIQQHLRNAENANALYPQIFADMRGLGTAGQERLAGALRPVIEAAQRRAGNKNDAINQALREHSGNFLDAVEVQGAGSMQPLTRTVTTGVDEATGAVTQEMVPLTKIIRDESGNIVDRITSKYNQGGVTKRLDPAGDLESILERRRALQDAIDAAFGDRKNNLGNALAEFRDELNMALRTLGGGSDEVGQVMGRWAAANDARAQAGTLQRVYDEALGINLKASAGESLSKLERFLTRFRGAGAAGQDMMRRGVIDQLVGKLQGKGDMADTARIFSNPRTRRILTEIIGPDATEEFAGFIARAGLATNTFNKNKNSVTSSVLDADKESGWLSSIAHALWHGNPLRAVGTSLEHGADMFKRQKHDAMTGLLRRDTSRPWEVEQSLKTLNAAITPFSAAAARFEEQLRRAGIVTGGSLGGRQPWQ